jgi:hypothetical protein
MILFKKQLFDLEVKGQGPTKVIMVRDTPPYGHALTYQISLTYLERQRNLILISTYFHLSLTFYWKEMVTSENLYGCQFYFCLSR